MFAIIGDVARLRWTQKQDIGPSPRTKFGMAYDPARKLTYLFGGVGLPASLNGDTWAWDGRYWTQISNFGPEKRIGHSMTFDTAWGHTVLFGGFQNGADGFQDTWVFNGVDWTQLEDIGPTPRNHHAAAYDSVRQRLVLFGGDQRSPAEPAFLNDTWEWDGIAWTQVEETGPSPRSSHLMAYDSFKKRVVLFGGLAAVSGGGFADSKDTWEWDGESWRMVADTGPTARRDGAMTSIGGVVILHGGLSSGKATNDTWQWVSDKWSKVQEIGPRRRRGHAMAYDSARNRMVLFGGHRDAGDPGDAEFFGDTWEAPGPTSG